MYEKARKTESAVRMCRAALQRLPLNGNPTTFGEVMSEMAEIQARLEHLQPGSSKSAKSVTAAADNLARMRSFRLPRLVPGTATADFFVLLASDAKTPGFKAMDAKFISGSETLKSYGKSLTASNFNMMSPDGVATRLVRRGTLGCYPASGCSFVLLDPTSVTTLN